MFMTNNVNNQRLANELRRFRRSNDLSLDDFGPELDKATLSRIERCEGNPDSNTLAKVAQKVHTPVDAFFLHNEAKVIHFSDASTINRIAAVLYSDSTLNYRAKNALLDLMTVAIEEAGQ